MRRFTILTLAFVALSSFSRAQPADLVVRGANVHTVDSARPQATAFAVRDGRFVAVGSDAELAPLVGPATRVLELAGKTIVPGFNDAHIHPRPLFPADSPWAAVDAGPTSVKTIGDLVAALRRKASMDVSWPVD